MRQWAVVRTRARREAVYECTALAVKLVPFTLERRKPERLQKPQHALAQAQLVQPVAERVDYLVPLFVVTELPPENRTVTEATI
jgi:hypothetical protein